MKKILFVIFFVLIASSAFAWDFYYLSDWEMCFKTGDTHTYVPCDKIPFRILKLGEPGKGFLGLLDIRSMTVEEKEKYRSAIIRKYGSVSE
jgi:hypothetical protein